MYGLLSQQIKSTKTPSDLHGVQPDLGLGTKGFQGGRHSELVHLSLLEQNIQKKKSPHFAFHPVARVGLCWQSHMSQHDVGAGVSDERAEEDLV